MARVNCSSALACDKRKVKDTSESEVYEPTTVVKCAAHHILQKRGAQRKACALLALDSFRFPHRCPTARAAGLLGSSILGEIQTGLQGMTGGEGSSMATSV